MDKRQLRIYALDKEVNHDIKMVHIFTSKYSKKIRKNEVHTPKAAKLVVENENKLLLYTLLNPIIKSDKNGNIELFIAQEWKKIIGKKEYYSDDEIKISKHMSELYHSKKNLGLSVSEMIEKDHFSAIADFEKVLKIKIPYIIGGGF